MSDLQQPSRAVVEILDRPANDSTDTAWKELPRTGDRVWKVFRLVPSLAKPMELFRNEHLNPADIVIAETERASFLRVYNDYSARIKMLADEISWVEHKAAERAVLAGGDSDIDIAALTDRRIEIKRKGRHPLIVTGGELIEAEFRRLSDSKPDLSEAVARGAAQMSVWRRVNLQSGDLWFVRNGHPHHVKRDLVRSDTRDLRRARDFLVETVIGVTIAKFGQWGALPNPYGVLGQVHEFRRSLPDFK